MKLIKKLEGVINCMDDQMLSYNISYSCQFTYNILDYFKIKKQLPVLLNTIEGTIKEIVAENSLKVFKEKDLKQYQKEYSKYINFKKTNEAQRDVQDMVILSLGSTLKSYNYDLIKFQMIPFDICHSLHAALN